MQTHFLNLTQGLEVLHRRTTSNSLTNKETFKEIVDNISKSLPANLDERLRNKILSSIGYAYEPGLKDRISEILELIPKDMLTIFIGDTERFSSEVVKGRNYLTHYSNNSNLNDKPMKMALRAEQMLFVIACLLLREIGIPADYVKESLKNRFEYLSRWKDSYEDA